MRPIQRKLILAATCSLSALMSRQSSFATEINSTWVGGIGNWSSATNWSTNPQVPSGESFNGFISSGTATVDTQFLVGNLTLSGGQLVVNKLLQVFHFSDPTPSAFTWTGGTLSGTNVLAVNNAVISIPSATLDAENSPQISSFGSCTFAAGTLGQSISGATLGSADNGGLVKTGTGTTTFSGNLYAGNISVQSGTLLCNAQQLSLDNDIFVAPGAALQVNGGSGEVSHDTTFSGAGSTNIAATSLTFLGNITINNSPTLSGFSLRQLTAASGSASTLNNSTVIGPIIVADNAQMTVNSCNVVDLDVESGSSATLINSTYNGALTLENGSKVHLAADALAGFSDTTISNGAELIANTTDAEPHLLVNNFFNSGVLTKTGSGALVIYPSTAAVFAGTTNVQQGQLQVNGISTSISGTFVVARDATAWFISQTTIDPTAQLDIDLPNPDFRAPIDFYDSNLSGDLHLTFPAGAQPRPQDVFQLISSEDSLTGTFNNLPDRSRVYLDNIPGSFEIHYTPDSVYLDNFIAPSAQWLADSDGNWGDNTKWIMGVPNVQDAPANFLSAITTPQTITLDANYTAGSITFNNTNRYTLAGPGALTLQNSSGTATIHVITGNHTISAPLVFADNTLITIDSSANTLTITGGISAANVSTTKSGAGTLAIGENANRLGALAVQQGTLEFLPGISRAIQLSSLAISSGATLDLTNNSLILNYTTTSPAATIRSLLAQGYNNGLWTGNGITSSAAANYSNQTTALGYAEASDLGLAHGGTFDATTIANQAILIKYTYYGDSNLDGVVNLDDFSIFIDGFNGLGSGWIYGDFNYDGVIDQKDFAIFVSGFNLNGQPLSTLENLILNDNSLSASQKSAMLSVVPEPCGIGMAAMIGAWVAAGRRARRTKRS